MSWKIYLSASWSLTLSSLLQKEVSDNQPLHQKFLEEVQAEIRTKLVERRHPGGAGSSR